MADRARVLADLAMTVARIDRGEPLPMRLCRAAVELLGASGGSMTLASADPERLTVFSTDPVAARLEDLQDVLGEGPGFDAYRTRQAVSLTLGAKDAPFRMFSDMAVRAAGEVTIHALPMRSAAQAVGVLTVYTEAGAELMRPLDDAQFLADAVGAALLEDPTTHASGDAWLDRARVHQATGMIVAQLGIGVDDALALLRAHAFAQETTMDDIATTVVDRRLSFGRSDDAPGETPPRSSEIEER